MNPPPIEVVPIGDLFCSPSNPRKNAEAVPHVAASLRRFGWQQPVVAKRSGEVIAGNTRLLAAQEIGMAEVPVWWFEGDDLDATAFAIADNRTHEFATWHEAELAKLLDTLRAEDAIDGVGYLETEVDTLLAKVRTEERASARALARSEGEDEPEEPPSDPVAERGDLWLLGDHRLLCGDSTNLEDVLRVMDGDKAALVATDPPYLVEYTGKRGGGLKAGELGKDWSFAYNEIPAKDADKFFRALFTNVLEVLGDKAAIYCWHAHKRGGDIQRVWKDLGILDAQQIVWVKPISALSFAYWQFRHEPCFMGWRKGDKPPLNRDRINGQDSVWEVDWEGKKKFIGDHPTSKPVELSVRPILRHTEPGDPIFEPFSGSGSQLIAAEKTGRRCRAIEISPPFVDAAIRRWEKYTGEQAVLGDGDGRTFEEVGAMKA